VRTRNAQNDTIAASMAGAVAALLCLGHHTRGLQSLPAGGLVMLRGDAILAAKVDPADVRRLARAGVNSLVQRSPLHVQMLGDITQARHTSLAGQWNELSLRQEVLFILRRIRWGTHWTSFHQSTPELWQDLRSQVAAFLSELHARSVLVGEHAEKSFFVRCDADTNAGVVGCDGEVAFIVGFALRRADEFLAFRLQCARGACRISQLGWQSGIARAS
jgi:phage tail sheath protein FI